MRSAWNVKAQLVLAVVPTIAVITHYSCLLEQLQYCQVSQNLSFLFLVQISLRKAVLEISVGNIISGSGGLGDPPWSHEPTKLDRLKHWASVDLGLSPGFTVPAVKPFWISAASFIQSESPCTSVGGFKEVNVSSLPSTLNRPVRVPALKLTGYWCSFSLLLLKTYPNY